MNAETIASDDHLAEFCRWLAGAALIACDTEFVSEGRYRPELCLVQLAVRHPDQKHARLAVIDPLALRSTRPFWEALAAPGHQTVVHAGREELCFCLEATGRPPADLFDVQLAAGMAGYDYPAGYTNLTARLLGENPGKAETRTDWGRRPLSQHQVEYALNDVRYLGPLRDKLHRRLDEQGRLAWLADEIAAWQTQVRRSGEDQWRRIPGCSGMSGRELAIVRELAQWRDQEGRRRNKPPRRILRDDLIVELARRRTAEERRILALRDFKRRDYRALVPDISRQIETALKLPPEECPRVLRRDNGASRTVLGQFLAATLAGVCRKMEIAPALVGGPSDVRDLVAYRLGEWPRDEPPPALACGWRAQVVGRLLDELLHGRLVVRVADPHDEQPLAFEPPPSPPSP